MSRTRREEQRLLSKAEHELVSRTRQPSIKALADSDLSDLVSRLRQQRNRARDIARRKRREMRGKAGPSGIAPASDDSGSQGKRDLLAAALKRANKERERRRASRGRSGLVKNARRALAMKKAADAEEPAIPRSRAAHEGMRPLPNEEIAPSGALEAEGHRPVLERSRKVR